MALVRRLNMIDEYAALYVPASDSIHSDGLLRNLKIEETELAVVETFDPTLLVFSRVVS